MKKRKTRRRRVPPGATTDLNNIFATVDDVDGEVDALLINDPALGLGQSRIASPAVTPAGAEAGDRPLPVVLFQPHAMVGVTMQGGARQELQVESIIQSGFTRWRKTPVYKLEQLAGWSVRQTPTGLELWDGGGIWARGTIRPDAAWWDAATRWGVVLAVYGFGLCVDDRTSPEERAADLHKARGLGLVAAALVAWQGLPLPEKVPWPGPSYDPETGRFATGVGPGGAAGAYWQLHTPGQEVHHGVIIGPPEIGKTTWLQVVMAEVLSSGRFLLWAADPGGGNDLSWAAKAGADWVATTSEETTRMLEAAVGVVEHRQRQTEPSSDPRPERPGVVIAIDDCQGVFAGNQHATRLAERIVTAGGPVGVGLVVTSRGADLAYFGGSETLRARLARTNLVGMGHDGLDLVNQAKGDQE